MAKIPPPTDIIVEKIDAYHENLPEGERYNFSVSQIGHKCDRWLWLSYRKAIKPRFSGRIKRLFRRGHNEELTVVRDLISIGLDVRHTGNQQAPVDLGDGIRSVMDGVIYSGVPQSPNNKHVLEIKTHSKKSFDDLSKKGVVESKPMHHDQMQVYMLGSGIDRALYVAVCKDDDRMHTERVKLNKEYAQKLVDRAKRISQSNRMPEPIAGASPTWYECKFCDAYDFCHKTQLLEKAHCRTCAYATPNGADFHCEKHGQNVPENYQLHGCDEHLIHHDLTPWRIIATDENNQTFENGLINGREHYSSAEIVANPEMCVSNDKNVNAIKREFGGRVC